MHTFKIDRACFYWLSGSEIIGYSNKDLWIRACICWHDFAGRTHPY